MITAIAIDDEPLALKVIENFCSKIDYIDLQKTFTKPNEALKHLRKFPADLLFLDIQMPSMSGIELYKAAQQNTMVIFTTAYSEYAVEGFNLNAVDYLLKPYTFERFQQSVQKANDIFSTSNKSETNTPQHLLVRADYSLIKVNFADIVLIEGLDDYLKIHIQDQKSLVTRMTMKSILEKLPTKDFVRVHRSFIVSIKRIEKIRSRIIFIGAKEIPIGSSYEEGFFQHYKI